MNIIDLYRTEYRYLYLYSVLYLKGNSVFIKQKYFIILSMLFLTLHCPNSDKNFKQNSFETSEKKPQITEQGFVEDLFFCFKEYCIPNKDPFMISQEFSPTKNIIFDLNEVLFTTSIQTYIKKVPAFFGFEFSRLFQGRLPNFKIKPFFEDAIRDIPGEFSNHVAYHEGKPLLPVMNDWQKGKDVFKIVTDHIDAKDIPKSDKVFLKAIASTFFVPEQFAASKKPIAHVVQMLIDLKDAGYKLYVLSNWDAQSFPIFCKMNSEIMNLFDGMMISGDEMMVKPDQNFFRLCLNRFNLKAEECLFIDDQEINVNAAIELGMKAFTFDPSDKKSILAKMQEYQIVENW